MDMWGKKLGCFPKLVTKSKEVTRGYKYMEDCPLDE